LAKVSKEPVDKIMPTFVQQPGAPMVSVRTQCLGGSTIVTLSQRRYFSDRRMYEAGSKELWQVPVCVKEGGEGETGHEKCVLLTKKEESVTLPGCGSWVMANAGAHGYYRSGYSSDAIRAMGRSLEHELTQSERIVLLGDSWASVRVGEQQIGDYLALAEGVRSDRTRAVLSQVTVKLEYIDWPGKKIRQQAHLFIAREHGQRFLGYLNRQRSRLLGERSQRTNRPELVEQYGLDTKFASHAMRIAMQGTELMRTGRITLPMIEEDRQFLIGVREGSMNRDQAVHHIDSLERQLVAAISESPLPAFPDYEKINTLLVHIYRQWWEERG